MRRWGCVLALLGLPALAAGQGVAPSEPDWVSEFVAAGELPPVGERLPAEPVVVPAEAMPDGPGTWGDTLRIAVPGVPEGWNLWAGQDPGGAALGSLLVECLAEEAEGALRPNLAESWEDEDGALVVRLREGLRWSDGDPFDAEDLGFLWAVLTDPEVARSGGRTAGELGVTGLAVVDSRTIRVEGPEAALAGLCPPPSHALGAALVEGRFAEAMPPQWLNGPTLGPWVVVDHWPLDMVVLRRNPFYWKVDAEGRQLPYLDEVQVFLEMAEPGPEALRGGIDLAPVEGAAETGEGPVRVQAADGRALAVGRRLRNLPEGTPDFPQGWAPEALWAEKPGDFELHPRTLPGRPGEGGPVPVGGSSGPPGGG